MKSRLLAMAGAAACLLPLASGQALAGFDRPGCGTTYVAECYRQVTTPDLYTTRHRTVMVKPGWWESRTEPAVYGSRKKQVLVQPGQTVWHTQPAQYGVVHEQRVVRPGYDAWVRRGGHHGRLDIFHMFHRRDHGHPGHVHDEMCKVHVPPQVESVPRTVMVAPEKRVAQHIPARYDWVDEPYMIRPAKTTRVYHPPVYDTVSERVLVQRGTTSWQPVGRGHVAAPVAPAPMPVVDMPVRKHRHHDSFK
jgi:hypothetical protein